MRKADSRLRDRTQCLRVRRLLFREFDEFIEMSGQGIESKGGLCVIAVAQGQNALAFANRAHGHVEEAFLVFETAAPTAFR